MGGTRGLVLGAEAVLAETAFTSACRDDSENIIPMKCQKLPFNDGNYSA